MERKDLLRILKDINSYGIDFYLSGKMVKLPPEVVVSGAILNGLNLFNNDVEYLKSLSTIDYLKSEYWRELSIRKLERDPKCQGCGNKAIKVYKTEWLTKGEETLDDVVSLCSKCKVIDGEVVSHKQIKQEIRDAIRQSPEFKEMLQKEVEEKIIKTTKDYLEGRNSREVKEIL